MRQCRLQGLKRFFLLMAMITACVCACENRGNTRVPAYEEYRRQAFEQLVAIREEKAAKIEGWLRNQQKHLAKGQARSRLMGFFEQMGAAVDGSLDKNRFLQLNQEIERFFVYQLGAFYDLLFIDDGEMVFYSVKMEDDFRSSLATGAYADTHLAEMIKKAPKQPVFVDFQYYAASDEPAAFYILPVWENDRYKGAIALQLSINHLNQLLTERSGLGRTGEAYLVNEKHLMLTESRFINAGTVLSKKIDTRVVKSRIGSSGRDVITDYRGVRVLSTFAGFPVGSTSWRLIVEKDEDEVLTDYYKTYSHSLFPLLTDAVTRETEAATPLSGKAVSPVASARRVDVSELVRAGDRKQLYTSGLATCTGVVAFRKGGGAAYMAHLSPVDDSYDLSRKDQKQVAGRSSDLVSQLLRRIHYFDIKPCQSRELRFLIVAPHAESLQKIIHKLIHSGISLSQIKAGILDAADNVSLFFDVPEQSLVSVWHFSSQQEPCIIEFADLPDLGSLVAGIDP